MLSSGFLPAANALLRFAATLERGSEHPLAAAIVKGAEERGIALGTGDGFESMTGQGVRGRVEGAEVVLGNRTLLEDLGVTPGALAERAEELHREGQTVVFVAVDNKIAGLLGVADPIKPSTREAIDQLHKDGIRIVMVTGDNRTTAEAVARKLGIDEVIAEVLPDKKADAVKRLETAVEKIEVFRTQLGRPDCLHLISRSRCSHRFSQYLLLLGCRHWSISLENCASESGLLCTSLRFRDIGSCGQRQSRDDVDQ